MTIKVYNLIDGSSFLSEDVPDEATRINVKRNVCFFDSEDETYTYKFRLSINKMNDKVAMHITYLYKNKVFKTRCYYLNYYTYFFPLSTSRGIFIQMLTQGLGYIYVSDV